jgi:hypothetical protein
VDFRRQMGKGQMLQTGLLIDEIAHWLECITFILYGQSETC